MKKVLTIILDGFGLRNAVHGNAVKLAKMPNFKKLWNEYPHSQLLASERAVGLEKGQMGNSEVGHTTIGAGRLIKQNFMEITDWFSKKEILKNENFLKMVEYAKENDIPVKLEELKVSIREHQEKAKEKYLFILPFNQNISLKEHLEKYKKQVSAREKKSLKLFKKQEKKETKNKG